MTRGDAIFIPAGTVHTIGAGLVLCEIQQLSDITYRVFDYNRRDAHGRARELHIEKALAVSRFDEPSPGKISAVQIQQRPITKTYLAACPYFAAEKWDFAGAIALTTNAEHFELLIILEGAGIIEASGERIPYGRAQVFLFPGALGKFSIAPSSPTSLLRTYVPYNLEEFTAPLTAAGIDSATIAKLVHP
jgi:mannose-6-phosphate isomerase